MNKLFNRIGSLALVLALLGIVSSLTFAKDVTLTVKDHNGAGISGLTAYYYTTVWVPFSATTNGSGVITQTIPDAVIHYKADCNYTTKQIDLSALITTVDFQTYGVTVEVQNSAGTLFDVPTPIRYHSGAPHDFGLTSGGSVTREMFPGTYHFYADWKNTTIDKTVTIAGNSTVVLQTTKAIVTVKTSDGTPLSGVPLRYHSNNNYSFGTTDGFGEASLELFAGNYHFYATYNNTTKDIIQNIGVDPTIDFVTNKVTAVVKTSEDAFIPDVPLSYYSNNYYSMGSTGNSGGDLGKKSIELFPGNYHFYATYNFTSKDITQTISDLPTEQFVDFKTTKVVATVLTSGGLPINGAALRYYSNAYHPFGTTGIDGTGFLELFDGTYYFYADHNFTTQTIHKAVSNSDPNVNFQTTKTIVRLTSCDGTEIPDANVEYYSNAYHNIGLTDALGQASVELFDGHYYFRVTLNHTSNAVWDDVVGGIEDHTFFVPFTARPVEIVAPAGSIIKYYSGAEYLFTSGMLLMPGKYQFRYLLPGYSSWWIYYTIDPCPGSLGGGDGAALGTFASVKLESSTGGGLAGGKVYSLDGTWNPFGFEIFELVGGFMVSYDPPQYDNITPASGIINFMIPSNKTNVKFHMTYRGGDQEITQNMLLNANVVFKTKKVGISLLNSSGGIQPGGALRFYEPTGWFNLGNTDATRYIELLADKYYFDVTYLNQTLLKQFTVVTSADFTFKTRKVHVGLFDTRPPATEITTGFVVKYLAGTWMNFGSTEYPYDMEMLPVAQSINCNYMSKNKQKNLSATVNSLIFNWNGSVLSKLGLGELASDGISNEPNPFSDKTNIKFNLTSESNVKVSVYNAAGMEVSNLFEGTLKAGDHEYTFRSDGLSSGAYYCIISVDGVPTIKPMMIAK